MADCPEYNVRIHVGLSSELNFYRSEIMHDGIFLNYYIDGRFSGTFVHGRHSLTYNAFSSAYELSFNNCPERPNLLNLDQNLFIDFLRKLGYKDSSSEETTFKPLESKRKDRFDFIAKKYGKVLKA
jgi:hypothetical protein